MEKGDGGKEGVSVCVVWYTTYTLLWTWKNRNRQSFFLPKKWKRRFFGLPLLPYVEVLCGGGVPNFLKRAEGGADGPHIMCSWGTRNQKYNMGPVPLPQPNI